MKLISIKPSTRQDKKYMAEFCLCNTKQSCCDKKTIVHFGASGYTDFILSGGDEERKQRYLSRHRKNENWEDFMTAGSLSRYILWNKPSLNESIKDYKLRFNL